MIKIHFLAKFRAFGITFGTIEDTKDVTAIVALLASKIVPSVVALSGLKGLSGPCVLYSDRGVLIELV